MTDHTYKTVLAPKKPNKIKGVRNVAERFSQTVTDLINAEAAGGWDYVRAETLEYEAKSGALSRAKIHRQTLLIFRKAKGSVTPLHLHDTQKSEAAFTASGD